MTPDEHRDCELLRGEEVFKTLQRMARADGAGAGRPAPTAEYLTRHALESFLDRLTRTRHASTFVLKGGILLGIYGVRRPTKDIDAEAIGAPITPDHLQRVVYDVTRVGADDGVVFDVGSVSVQEIRGGAQYAGLRVRLSASLGAHQLSVAWDISTGDPIIPPPELVQIPRILGDPITMLGYAPETTVAEKGVTILERGITSTRWRDYIDIVRLSTEYGLDQDVLLQAARAVARYRDVTLRTISPVVAGYGAVGRQAAHFCTSKASAKPTSMTRWPKSPASSTRYSSVGPQRPPHPTSYHEVRHCLCHLVTLTEGSTCHLTARQHGGVNDEMMQAIDRPRPAHAGTGRPATCARGTQPEGPRQVPWGFRETHRTAAQRGKSTATTEEPHCIVEHGNPRIGAGQTPTPRRACFDLLKGVSAVQFCPGAHHVSAGHRLAGRP